MTDRNKLRPLSLLVSAIILFAAISGCVIFAPAASASGVNADAAEGTQSAVTGDPQKGYTTILIIGLDEYERPDNIMGYMNSMQADYFVLMVLNDHKETVSMLHINRDTMTKINRIGVFGDVAGTFEGQLALSHTYGSGGSDSCLNSVKAVSNLLGGIRIDHYITFTMDAVATMNDMVGGVTIEMRDDFSEIDPKMVVGETINLNGKQALAYVRNRRDIGDNTNISRMERQREYMEALYACMLDHQRTDPEFTQKMLYKLSNSLMTDYSVPEFITMSDTSTAYERQPFLNIDGDAVVGEMFMEFYPDPMSIEFALNKLFDGRIHYER